MFALATRGSTTKVEPRNETTARLSDPAVQERSTARLSDPAIQDIPSGKSAKLSGASFNVGRRSCRSEVLSEVPTVTIGERLTIQSYIMKVRSGRPSAKTTRSSRTEAIPAWSSSPSTVSRFENASPGYRHRRATVYNQEITGRTLWAIRVRDNRVFRTILAFCLAIALFGGAFWQICNLPDDTWNTVLDVTMCTVTGFFLLDLFVQCVSDPIEYPFSFFFWMEALGSASMLFEISFLLGPAGKMKTPDANVDGMVMRAARTAKLGARAGRLIKLLKCLSFIFGTDDDRSHGKSKRDETQVLGARLAHYLSTKAAMLTILFVLILPLFELGLYPEDDLSLRGWAQRLENDYSLDYNIRTLSSAQDAGFRDIFKLSIEEMNAFYSNVNYRPYKIEGYPSELTLNGQQVSIPGTTLLLDSEPNRKQNIVRQVVEACTLLRPGCDGGQKAAIYFDFTVPGQFEAIMSVVTIIFMISAMFGMSFALMYTVNSMVLKPLERILGSLRQSASYILIKALRVLEARRQSEQTEEVIPTGSSELEMLETVFNKLRKIIEIHTATHTVHAEELEDMDDESKGVIVDMMQMPKARKTMVRATTLQGEGCLQEYSNVVKDLPVDRMLIDSWNLHVLELDSDDQQKIILHVFFDSELARLNVRHFLEESTFTSFGKTVKDGYFDAPYHNFTHACDVTYAVYNLLRQARAHEWLDDIDQFALLVASLCHDLGHEGKTNPFLVETHHKLALRYNDLSPLENMHAASLFEICGHADTNVFRKLDKLGFQQARKVAVSAILHTDNSHHFEMVKTVRGIYELQMEICELQATEMSGEYLDATYKEEVMQAHSGVWTQLFLHLADVSNPLRPFKVCHAWAMRVLDEFFDQGDEEKKLGLPVGMLNDRDKINRPHSQHGFIKFLVAPFATVSVQIFPALHPLTSNMAANLQEWRNLWEQDAEPSAQELVVVDDAIEKIKESCQDLVERCAAIIIRPPVAECGIGDAMAMNVTLQSSVLSSTTKSVDHSLSSTVQ